MPFYSEALTRQVRKAEHHVTAVRFILFHFANYSPSIAMELKASNSKENTWRFETNKCLLRIIIEVANRRDQL